MNYFILNVIIFIIVEIQIINCAKCPASETLRPCTCVENSLNIYCSEDYEYNLRAVFENVSQHSNASERHFGSIYMDNTAIKELVDNTFADITFDEIHIQKMANLTKISPKAFGKNDMAVKYLELRETPVVVEGNNYSLFDTFNQMTNLEKLEISKLSFNSIPSNLFSSPNTSTLRFVSFRQSGVKMLGENAFYNLDQLQYISLFENKIDFIPKQAFRFKNNSTHDMILDLSYNKLNLSSFSVGAFAETKRRVHIILSGNNLPYLDEQVFRPIFTSGHSIDCFNCPLDCGCKNLWLYKERALFKNQIYNAECEDDTDLLDEIHYAKCT